VLCNFYVYSLFYFISHSLFVFLCTENQCDFFLLKVTTVPCVTSNNTVWNTLVTWLRGWYSVRVWDNIICDGTITKEVQANHSGSPIGVFSRLLEHHGPHKDYNPGVRAMHHNFSVHWVPSAHVSWLHPARGLQKVLGI
jgi:hypothetical protein